MVWLHENGFSYKTMAFKNSAFPCCLHVALYNLGHFPQESDSIEADFAAKYANYMGYKSSLNETAPSCAQVELFLRIEPRYMEHCYHIQKIENAADEGETLRAIAALRGKPYAILCNDERGAHAGLLLRTKGTRFVHMTPWFEIDRCSRIPVCIKNGKIVSATWANPQNSFGIGLLYDDPVALEKRILQYAGDRVFIFS